jgi:hypothetical protein
MFTTENAHVSVSLADYQLLASKRPIVVLVHTVHMIIEDVLYTVVCTVYKYTHLLQNK